MTALFTSHPRRLRVSINDEVVKTLPDITVNASLDQLATVAEFSLASRPSPAPVTGDTVLIEYLNLYEELAYPLFGGTIDGFETDTSPWLMRVRCVDQLELFRRTRTGTDLDLTGMTDGEAWMAIADYCGITYDPADIADQGYELGAHEAVKWHADGQTPASRIIQELDAVFRTATLTIGDNQVIRLAYEPFPDSAGSNLYATFTKGSSIDYFTHHRSYGGRDQIQTIWNVLGVTHEEANGCTDTPWARAVSGSARLGAKVRTVEQSFQSDLIQDESLAEAIVRWKMGETSRDPDRGSADLETDPQIHPGTKIAIQDNTYGITAVPRYYLVTAVQVNGYSTSVELAAGPGGDEGTVTTGVDRVCGDSHSDTDWDDGFSFPGFGELPGLDGIGIDPIDFEGIDAPLITPFPPDEPVVCEEVTQVVPHYESGEFALSPWREVTGPWTLQNHDGTAIAAGDALTYKLTNPSGILYLNSDETPTHTDATDVELGPGAVFSLCADVAFCGTDSTFSIGLTRTDTDNPYVSVTWYSEPDGLEIDIAGDVRSYAGVIVLGNGGATMTDHDWGPSEFGGGALHRNTGRHFPHGGGAPVPVSGPGDVPDDFHFYTLCASFNLADQYQHGYAEGDGGSGHGRSEQCITAGCVGGGEPATYTPDPYTHNVYIRGFGGFADPTCPPVLVQNIAMGTGDCVVNPDYTEPETR